MSNEDESYTRRQYLLMRAMLKGANWESAMEAIGSTVLAHPEWDMEERRTYRDWEAGRGH